MRWSAGSWSGVRSDATIPPMTNIEEVGPDEWRTVRAVPGPLRRIV